MIRSMITSANTMSQLQQSIDRTGNNLSNMDTIGYKAKDSQFHELLNQEIRNDKFDKVVRSSKVGLREGVGARLGQIQADQSVGSMTMTSRDLDFALQKPGQYFDVLTSDRDGNRQVVHTRQGVFYISPGAGGQLMLVTGEGSPVLDAGGRPIVFAGGQVKSYTVRPGGVLRVDYGDRPPRDIQLGVTEVRVPQAMVHVSDTYIAEPDGGADKGITRALTGAGRATIELRNGMLESSNVDMQKEMTDLISDQRAYQFNGRVISMGDQMMGLINGIR